MKFYCEKCNKLYSDIDEAKACELRHIEEEKAEKEKYTQKKKRWEEVKAAKSNYYDLLQRFLNDYNEPVKIQRNPFSSDINDFISRML